MLADTVYAPQWRVRRPTLAANARGRKQHLESQRIQELFRQVEEMKN